MQLSRPNIGRGSLITVNETEGFVPMDGLAPLRLGAWYSLPSCVRLCLDRGVDVDIDDEHLVRELRIVG